MDKAPLYSDNSEAIRSSIWPAEEFQYDRLTSTTCIRLIKIHTELINGDISCTLEQFETGSTSCPPFAALSYVWGDPSPRHTIYINGRVRKVHHSLWQFLDRYRTMLDTECHWFWTDLLCIDQAHRSEKNEQISRMGHIYAQAKYVISWLGEDSATVDALNTLIEMSQDDGLGNPVQFAWNSPESARIHKACDQLAFQEPYWERVWIQQEVACAKDCFVACSEIFINYQRLVHLMRSTMGRSDRFGDADCDRRVERMERLVDLKTRIQEGKSMSMLDLIVNSSFCHATRDQDRVYGLLGLGSRLDPEFDCHALRTSYDKSLGDILWDIIFMKMDDKSEVWPDSSLTSLHAMVKVLQPPLNHLKLGMNSSIRRNQAQVACQVSEAAYSTSVVEFLGVSLLKETTQSTQELFGGGPQTRLRKGWEKALTHVCEHQNSLPTLQTVSGRSAFAALQFTSWQFRRQELPETRQRYLPSGWFCAAHLPDHLRDTAPKHRIVCQFDIQTRTTSHPIHCSEAQRNVTCCNLSMVALNVAELGITCILRPGTGGGGEVTFYCDCCHPDAQPVCTEHDLDGIRARIRARD